MQLAKHIIFGAAQIVLLTELAFNATKDDDDLLEKKSVIFCWLSEVTLFLHPGNEAQINQGSHHFWCAQKPS